MKIYVKALTNRAFTLTLYFVYKEIKHKSTIFYSLNSTYSYFHPSYIFARFHHTVKPFNNDFFCVFICFFFSYVPLYGRKFFKLKKVIES